MDDLFTVIRRLRQQGTPAAVATVVQVIGSAYRKEGAWMVITAGGGAYGAISGGCLESDVAEVAQDVIATGKSRLLHYDNTAEDEMLWGLALGCNGIVEVLVQPLAAPTGTAATVPAAPAGATASTARGAATAVGAATAAGAFDLYGELDRYLLSRIPVVVATVLESQHGAVTELARMLIARDSRVGFLGHRGLVEAVAADAAPLLAGGRSLSCAYQLRGAAAESLPLPQCPPDGVRVFLEAMQPPPRLVVLGGGHDAIPLTHAARPLGYDITVVDNRPKYADPERFSAAHRVVCATPEETPAQVALDGDTFVLVMTHHFPRDVELLAWALPSPARYVGVLGPRERTERLLKSIAERGVEPTPAQFERLYAPVGLDIGGGTPEEIAASILAEIQAVRHRRGGGHLRRRASGIHE